MPPPGRIRLNRIDFFLFPGFSDVIHYIKRNIAPQEIPFKIMMNLFVGNLPFFCRQFKDIEFAAFVLPGNSKNILFITHRAFFHHSLFQIQSNEHINNDNQSINDRFPFRNKKFLHGKTSLSTTRYYIFFCKKRLWRRTGFGRIIEIVDCRNDIGICLYPV